MRERWVAAAEIDSFVYIFPFVWRTSPIEGYFVKAGSKIVYFFKIALNIFLKTAIANFIGNSFQVHCSLIICLDLDIDPSLSISCSPKIPFSWQFTKI